MSQIKNLSEIKNVDSFIQIDLVKGYKYVDKAGEIVNVFATEDHNPTSQIGMDGVVFNNPTNEITEFKVSSQIIWAHFSKPGSLEIVERNFNSRALTISEILSVKTYKRIGWRNVFIYYPKKKDIDAFMNKLSIISDVNITALNASFEVGDEVKVNLQIRPVLVIKEEKKGIAFDLDVFTEKKNDFSKLNDTVKSLKTILRGSLILKVINSAINSAINE